VPAGDGLLHGGRLAAEIAVGDGRSLPAATRVLAGTMAGQLTTK